VQDTIKRKGWWGREGLSKECLTPPQCLDILYRLRWPVAVIVHKNYIVDVVPFLDQDSGTDPIPLLTTHLVLLLFVG